MKERSISFQVGFAKELKSINAALFYQQIRWWSDKGEREDGWFYKSHQQMEDETSLSMRQQALCREILVKKGWIAAKKMRQNGSNVWHYQLLVDFKLTKTQVRTYANRKFEHTQTASSEHTQTASSSITEMTQEMTLTERENSESLIDPKTGKKPTSLSGWTRAKRAAAGKEVNMVPKELSPELLEVDTWIKAHREMAESHGEDYSFMDDGPNPQIRKQVGAFIPKVKKLGKTMEDWITYLENNPWAKERGYNPLSVYTNAMAVAFAIGRKDRKGGGGYVVK